MKIRVTIIEEHFGYIDIDVPADSPILDPNASTLKKRKAAKKLAEYEITQGQGTIIFPDDVIPILNVELGYTTVDEED